MARSSVRPSKRFQVTRLEDRLTPVVGAYNIPVLGPGMGYDGVARVGRATGALLTSARHILTAAHTQNPNTTSAATFNVAGVNPNGVVIATPGADFDQHPFYFLDPLIPGPDLFDIGVKTLAELGPLTAERWGIYTEFNELNQVGTLVGWGNTGTGSVGASTDVNTNQYWPTATGSQTNFEVVRFNFTGNRTGGSFTIRSGAVGVNVPWNASAGQIANAFNSLPNLSQVQVRLVGDTDNNGVVNPASTNPLRGSIEAIIVGTNTANHSTPPISVVSNLVGGSVSVTQLLQGGSPRIRTIGRNAVGDISDDGFRFFSDFDDGTSAADILNDGLGQGANEGYGSWGDSGSPLFIDGKIAGVLEGIYNTTELDGTTTEGHDGLFGSSDFGSYDSWARVSAFTSFIDGIVNQQFDLVLNMNNQVLGRDNGAPDAIGLSRVGNNFQIRFNGEVVYSESLSLITSITVRGSGDAETFTLNNLNVGVPVTILGGDGNDRIIVSGTTPNQLTINGQSQTDVVELRRVGANSVVTVEGASNSVIIGQGNLDAAVFGQIIVNGSNIDVTLDDIEGVNSQYTFTKTTFDKSTMQGVVTLTALDDIVLSAADGNNTVLVSGLGANRSLSIDTFGGDDDIIIGSGRLHENILGRLVVRAGFGDDSVELRDTINFAGSTHYLSPTSYSNSDLNDAIDFHFVDDFLLRAGPVADTILVTADDPGVAFDIRGGFGGDTLTVGAVPVGTIRFDGQQSNDRANLTGSLAGTDWVLRGNRVSYVGAGHVDLINTEAVDLIGLGPLDRVTVQGTLFADDNVHITGTAVADAGTITGVGAATVNVTGIDRLDAIGQAFDDDQLTFHGTAVRDQFIARLDRAGTSAEPVLTLETLDGEDLLLLQDYVGFDLSLSGEAGNDRFFVYVGPEAPRDRNIRVVGGTHQANGNVPGDRLIVRYVDRLPRVDHRPSTTTPGSGRVTIGYTNPRFFGIDYEGIESVGISPL